jgi:hypothetical protein
VQLYCGPIDSSGKSSSGNRFEGIPALATQQFMALFRHHLIKNLLAACLKLRPFVFATPPIQQTSTDLIAVSAAQACTPHHLS